jgi:UDP-N-acetylglucosamine 2-epimerase (non-hydrolysing)
MSAADKFHVLCIVGTRPETIKMAPVIAALSEKPWAKITTMVSGQHRELLRQALGVFHITPDVDLEVMTENQTLNRLTARLFERLEPALRDLAPDIVLAQGDTTTVMAAALSCHYLGIKFGHVEAGLRSGNLRNPFPEEMNRIVAGVVSDLHFAPTARAAQALAKEHVPAERVVVTGNTVIDALYSMADTAPDAPWPTRADRRLILLTAHRRESFGAPLEGVMRAMRDVVSAHRDIELLFPVHPNPMVRNMAIEVLSTQERVHLVDPLPYAEFVAAMKRAHLVVSDSGGVQEEAPALGKPVLVIREETERSEAVAAGVARLIGTNPNNVRTEVERLLTDQCHYNSMARGTSPYGDGKGAHRIVDALEAYLGVKPRREMQDWAFEDRS